MKNLKNKIRIGKKLSTKIGVSYGHWYWQLLGASGANNPMALRAELIFFGRRVRNHYKKDNNV